MTWRDYIENVSIGKRMIIGLFTGRYTCESYVGKSGFAKIAQEVRVSENRIVMAEKMSVMAYLEINIFVDRQIWMRLGVH